MKDQARIRKLKQVFEEADNRLNHVAKLAGCEIPVRCVDQLIQGCRHLVTYVDSGATTEYDQALRCYEHAYFDVCEFEILHYLRDFKRLQHRYRRIAIPPVVPDYFKWQQAYADAKEFISQHSLNTDRDKVRRLCLQHAEVLHEISKQLPAAGNELEKQHNEIESMRSGIRHAKRLHWVGIVVGVIGFLAACIAWAQPDLLREFIRKLTAPTAQIQPGTRPNDHQKPTH